MELADVLADRWGRAVERIQPLDGGMNSHVWLVTADGSRFVVKVVEHLDRSFGPGLAAATRADVAGVTTGAPVPTVDGALFAGVGDQLVAVLRFVEGEPLTAAPEHHAPIGTTLGRVHEILRGEPGELAGWFDVTSQFDAYLDLEPWIRPAVRDAQEGVRRLAARHDLTWVELHGDPAPEAFLQQPSGEVALIDWGSSMSGPALYDVASAAMYLGGATAGFLAAYLSVRPESEAEVEIGLQDFLRFRGAVQAAYFAWRCAADVRTGLSGEADGNAAGLADARRLLGA